MKKVIVNENICLNCKLCEVYCKATHSKSKDIVTAYKREYPEPKAAIVVEGDNSLSMPISCRHCKKPLCVEACITGAMVKLPDGKVLNDKDRCIACMTCLAACPFGAVRIGNYAVKCDLCQDESEPQCVKNCPSGALKYIEVE